MTFAFDMGDTLTRYPGQLWTIMECLRLGGHKVIVLTAIGLVPGGAVEEARGILDGLGFNFDRFEVVTVPEDHTGKNKADYCRTHEVCMLIDNADYNMQGLREGSPRTARVQIVP